MRSLKQPLKQPRYRNGMCKSIVEHNRNIRFHSLYKKQLKARRFIAWLCFVSLAEICLRTESHSLLAWPLDTQALQNVVRVVTLPARNAINYLIGDPIEPLRPAPKSYKSERPAPEPIPRLENKSRSIDPMLEDFYEDQLEPIEPETAKNLDARIRPV